jgi:hypothetical protein
MVTHMKTTIELSDNLLLRAKQRAKDESVTLRALIEKALTAALEESSPTPEVKAVTFKGKGISSEFEDASWERIRDTIYP